MKLEIDYSEVVFSKQDLNRRVAIPKELSDELAEETGIHLGDGYLKFKQKNEARDYRYAVCCDAEDETYFYSHVSKLMKKLYNLDVGYVHCTGENAVDFEYFSKALVSFKLALGLPNGRKGRTLAIPETVYSSDFVNSCVRGIFDTDGNIAFKKKYRRTHYYPVLKIVSISEPLISQIQKVVEKIGMSSYCAFGVSHGNSNGSKTIENEIYVSGPKNLEKWAGAIGFSNPKHFTKYLIWKKHGFCPIKTTLQQRQKILSGELDPESFYENAGEEI